MAIHSTGWPIQNTHSVGFIRRRPRLAPRYTLAAAIAGIAVAATATVWYWSLASAAAATTTASRVEAAIAIKVARSIRLRR